MWFVPSGANKGMTNGDLLGRLDTIFAWCKERRIRFVVTNGIRDIDHSLYKAANRVSDDRRTSLLTKYLARRERADRMQVEVVSLTDVFVRYWTSWPEGSDLADDR
jgi:transposase